MGNENNDGYVEFMFSPVKHCACGKSHDVKTPTLILGNGAIDRLKTLIPQYGATKIYLIADKNTERVAGKVVERIINELSIPCAKCIFKEEFLAPNEYAVGSAIMHYESACDLIVAVGSGVINDIGKIVATTANKPYFIVATAPSMDGYASSTSSMEREGLKVSLPSRCADVIIGDIDVLKNAPMKMLQAGLGDMIAKYVSIAEWRIANLVIGEYYCENIANQVRLALRKCIENADGLMQREDQAVKAVFEGLVFCGKAMAFAGCSRPASGTEHYFSHIWDMRGLEFGLPVELHGLQCARATYIVVKLYEKLFSVTPSKEKALSYVKNFDYGDWSEQLKCFLGKGALTMIDLEKKECKYDKKKHAARLDRILQKWQDILSIVQEEIPKPLDIEEILKLTGMEELLSEQDDRELFIVFQATKDIRDKYVLSRLLWDLGLIEEMFFNNQNN